MYMLIALWYINASKSPLAFYELTIHWGIDYQPMLIDYLSITGIYVSFLTTEALLKLWGLPCSLHSFCLNDGVTFFCSLRLGDLNLPLTMNISYLKMLLKKERDKDPLR